MAKQLKIGQDEKAKLLMSRKNYENNVKRNEEEFKNKLKAANEKLEIFDELEESKYQSILIIFWIIFN